MLHISIMILANISTLSEIKFKIFRICLLSTIINSTDCTMRDLCNGFFWNNIPFFKADPLALQVILFFDDIEVANPIGAKARYHY